MQFLFFWLGGWHDELARFQSQNLSHLAVRKGLQATGDRDKKALGKMHRKQVKLRFGNANV